MGVVNFKFKDGYEGEGKLYEIHVELVDNGYVLTYFFDEEERKYVYQDKKEVLQALKDIL